MKNPIQMIKQCVANDEPYFLLRGKDICALPTIEKYYQEVKQKVRLVISYALFNHLNGIFHFYNNYL